MAFRSQKPRARCATCEALSDARCRRCGRFFCAAHGPRRFDERCTDCEREFACKLASRRHELASARSLTAGEMGLVAGVGIVSLIPVFATLPGVLVWVVPLLSVLGAASWAAASNYARDLRAEHLESTMRREFLADRRYPALADGDSI